MFSVPLWFNPSEKGTCAVRLENRSGAKQKNAKFTPEEAVAIVARFAHSQPKPSIAALARELGCSRRTISKLIHHESYRREQGYDY